MIKCKEDYEKYLHVENIEGEVWKSVVNYEGFYEVSNYGRIRSVGRYCNNSKDNGKHFRKGVIRKPRYNKATKYANVDLYKMDSKRKYFRVHRLVAEAFHGNIPKGYVVKHLNNNKQMNCEWNLKIDTSKNNTLDAYKDGLIKNSTIRYEWVVLNTRGNEVLRKNSSNKIAVELGYSSGRQVRDNCKNNRKIGLNNEYFGFTIEKYAIQQKESI
jgi:hypothetical protein